jgi:hypothetical protein
MKDPKLAAMMGQNPQAQALQAAAAAHIMERTAFAYRKEIEKQLGAALPPMAEEGEESEERVLPPEIEVQLSQLAAQAAMKLLQKNTAEAQQKQAAQQQQDPLIQMQQKELQIKEQEVQQKSQLAQAELQMKAQEAQQKNQLAQAELQRKSTKDQIDAAGRADDIRVREETLKAKQEYDGTKLGIEIKKHQIEQESKQELDGVRMGIDIAKNRTQMIQPSKSTSR